MNQRLSRQTLTLMGCACALSLSVSACDGCGNQKPYTPFGVASAETAVSAPPSAASTPGAAPAESAGFAARKAELVPGAPRSWQSGGLDLSAPDARAFAQVLSADFDGDQKLDALAWLVPAPNVKDAPPGELWYFPNGSAPRKLSALPGFVPSSADCPLTVTLNQTGAHSATLDALASCQTPLIARAPTRAIVVVSPTVEQPLLLTLRAAAPAPGETLNFSVDSSDQDQDGRDDVRVTLSVSGPDAGEPASADLVWLDRAAGASRSASEPGTSLLRYAGRLLARAHIKRGARGPERSDTGIRLLSSLCAEGGVARVLDEEGGAFRCGDLTRVIDVLTANDLEGALTQGDVLEAFGVLAREGWYFSKISSTERKTLERDLLHSVTKLQTDPAYAVRAQISEPRGPHYSPLWFESDAALLVRGEHGVTRVAADRSTEEAISSEAGVLSWALDVTAENGLRVTGTSHACDRSELLFTESDAQHPALPPLTTRLLAARPASCAGRGAGPPAPILPLSFDDKGLEALVGGSRISTSASGHPAPPTLPTLGTPRSPDGRLLVTASALGLLVTGDRKELWQTAKLRDHNDPSKFSDCVVANEARAIACVDAGHAVIFDRPK